MRTHGTLTKWNDDRGFGFISPAQGSEEIFVHISAFPRGERPRLNELVSYELETGPNGKLRAIRIMRTGQRPRAYRHRESGRPEHKTNPLGIVLGIVAVVAIGAYGYSKLTHALVAETLAPAAPAAAPASNYKCDGRTMCSQMTSCAEATYFLQHCPNTKMDGNNDGEPCEQQWCN